MDGRGASTTTAAPYAPLSFRVRLAASAASGLLAAATLARYGLGPRGLIDAVFIGVLPQLAAVDFEQRIIPNRIVLPTLAVVLVAQLAFFSSHALEWIAASLAAGAFLYLPGLFYKGAVGMGDVKLAALLGAALGTDMVTAFVVASFAVLPVALVILVRKGREARGVGIPFGPFLALGGAVVVLFG